MNRATSATGWVRNPDGTLGWTWNPLTGCLNHDNGLCKGGGFPCYAYKLANGRLKQRYLANVEGIYMPASMKSVLVEAASDPFYPRFWEERLSEPIENPTPMNPAKRKGIFTCDMSDLFGIGIPESWTEQVMTTIKLCPYHRFYLLTKQPQNLIKFSPFPENCWVGVTATNNQLYREAIYALAHIDAKVKYISFEPLLENVKEYLFRWIDWTIIGAQTKPYKPPEIAWLREIVEAADKAGIPVFLKDNLSPLIKWPDSGSWAFENLSNIIRQEMPK